MPEYIHWRRKAQRTEGKAGTQGFPPSGGLSVICGFFNVFLPFSINTGCIILHLAVNYFLLCSFSNVHFSGVWFALEGLK